MAGSIKLLIAFLDSLVDTLTQFAVNYIDSIGGVILAIIAIYAIKGFLAMLGD